MFDLPFNHSITIILITVAISLIAFNSSAVMNRLIFWPPAIRQNHEYDRFITHGFIHADGFHLLFNMMTLFFFGSVIEEFYRQYVFDMGFVLFYLGGLIVAILPSYFKHRDDTHWASLGASGAVSAVLFAFILFEPWRMIFVFFIPMPAILFAVLYVGYSMWAERRGNDNINHSAHLWGAAYGVIITVALDPSLLQRFINKLTTIPQIGF